MDITIATVLLIKGFVFVGPIFIMILVVAMLNDKTSDGRDYIIPLAFIFVMWLVVVIAAIPFSPSQFFHQVFYGFTQQIRND